MTLIQMLKNDALYARKNKLPESKLLVTLCGEASIVGKTNGNRESTDEEVLSVLKKFKTGAQSIIEAAQAINDDKTPSRIAAANFEISILDRYLPTMLTEEELSSYIEAMIECTSLPSIRTIMAELKKLFAGRFDGKLASSIIQSMLTEHS